MGQSATPRRYVQLSPATHQGVAGGVLYCWGHAREGWWGIVEWDCLVFRGGEPVKRTRSGQPMRYPLNASTWIPAASLSPADPPGQGERVTRVELPTDRAQWAAIGASYWNGAMRPRYLGVWEGGPPPLPNGMRVA